MRILKFLVVKAFPLVALGTVLSVWPTACAGHAPSATSVAAGQPTAPGAAALVPRAFLPEPAFAYAHGAAGSATIADIAEKAAPSVVNVASTRTSKEARGHNPLFEDPFFRHFFGPGFEEPEQRQKKEGLGSGVVVSAEGIVLTNNHVVDGADEIRVTTADRHEYGAEVIGTDAKSDVAVLRLSGDIKALHPLEIGDSSRLRLGDVVLAIGNPFGVGQTITMGIVSAKGRANVGIAAYEDFIQTDAAINPGNSGGALVDMEGKLVGINTAILSRSGGSMGIGFAIPTNMAKPIMQALLDHGKVVRGWLGVGIQDVDQDLASALGLANVRGVLISDVDEGGPASKAGLRSGDVVTKVNGDEMDSTGEFRNVIAGAGSGATVSLDLIRDGKSLAVKATLGVLPDKESGLAASGPANIAGGLDGLTLDDLGPAVRRHFQIPASVRGGVVVSAVDPGSPAFDSGLRPGDVIVEVNRAPVKDAPAFKMAYAKSTQRVLLKVVREGRTMFIVVKR